MCVYVAGERVRVNECVRISRLGVYCTCYCHLPVVSLFIPSSPSVPLSTSSYLLLLSSFNLHLFPYQPLHTSSSSSPPVPLSTSPDLLLPLFPYQPLHTSSSPPSTSPYLLLSPFNLSTPPPSFNHPIPFLNPSSLPRHLLRLLPSIAFLDASDSWFLRAKLPPLTEFGPKSARTPHAGLLRLRPICISLPNPAFLFPPSPKFEVRRLRKHLVSSPRHHGRRSGGLPAPTRSD